MFSSESTNFIDHPMYSSLYNKTLGQFIALIHDKKNKQTNIEGYASTSEILVNKTQKLLYQNKRVSKSNESLLWDNILDKRKKI